MKGNAYVFHECSFNKMMISIIIIISSLVGQGLGSSTYSNICQPRIRVVSVSMLCQRRLRS